MQITDEMWEAALRGYYRVARTPGPDGNLHDALRSALEAALGARPKCDSDLLKHLEAEIARLREALEPFASFANLIDGDPAANPTGDLCPLTLDYDRINDGRIVSLGDCRRARATLERWGLK